MRQVPTTRSFRNTSSSRSAEHRGRPRVTSCRTSARRPSGYARSSPNTAASEPTAHPLLIPRTRNASPPGMARRPVTCRNCGYTTTPVSGFCPRCLELLPVGPRFAAVPLLLGVLAAFVLGIGLTAALNGAAPGAVSVQETNVARTATPSSATTPPATTPSATTESAPAATPGQPVPSASSAVPPAAGAASSPAPTAAPLAPTPPGASPCPTAVLGVESLP